jgi:hypothetical protein
MSVVEMFPEYMFKYGPAGILAVWLFTVNTRLSDVEQRLYRCLESKSHVESFEDPTKRQNRLAILATNDLYALKPEDLKIKKKSNE